MIKVFLLLIFTLFIGQSLLADENVFDSDCQCFSPFLNKNAEDTVSCVLEPQTPNNQSYITKKDEPEAQEIRFTLKVTNDNNWAGIKFNPLPSDQGRTHTLQMELFKAYSDHQTIAEFDTSLYSTQIGFAEPHKLRSATYAQDFQEVTQVLFRRNNIPLHISSPISFREFRAGAGLTNQNHLIPGLAASQQDIFHRITPSYNFEHGTSGKIQPFAVAGVSQGMIQPLSFAKGKCRSEFKGEVGVNLVTYQGTSNVFIVLEADTTLISTKKSPGEKLLDAYFKYRNNSYVSGQKGSHSKVGTKVRLNRRLSAGAELSWYKGEPEGPLNPYAKKWDSRNRTSSVYFVISSKK
ncbi:MAG: hypothetical protein AB7F59_14935 [Bdellovibrionales bacterium]